MTNTSSREGAETAALVDFLELYLEDRRRGRAPDLGAYLTRFPGHEIVIAREFLRLAEEHARSEFAEPTANSEPTARETMTSDLVARLRGRPPQAERFTNRGEIARGGMGAILRIWDDDLRREIASKVMLGQGPRKVASFIEEAQITGHLDHPGIVPVHDIGVDSDDRLYFSMRLVRGRDLKQIIELARERREGWNPTRALDVILRVCEAMAYAHSKGVIHRDLKPSNVMVGEFGEVYVMDWGLARAQGRQDRHDIRLRTETTQELSSIRTLRRDEHDSDPDSPLVTMDGDVVGTPAYMSAEQAAGRVDELGPRSDVYSVGAMLYHLLTGQMPYVTPSQRITSRTVLAMLLQAPPRPVHELDRSNPAELVAICEKAMARRKEDRYPDMLAMARDMRAYLDGRVVAAYETGALAETKKWLVRNKALAASLGAGVLLLVGGLTTSLVFRSRAANQATRAEEQARIARVNESAAVQANEKLQVYKHAVSAEDLANESESLWPALPRMLPTMEKWMDRAQEVARVMPALQNELTSLRARASSYSDADAAYDASLGEERFLSNVQHMRTTANYLAGEKPSSPRATVLQGVLDRAIASVVRADEERRRRRTWRFRDMDDQRAHEALASAERSLLRLVGDKDVEGCLDSVRKRMESARQAERSLERDAATWNAAVERIKDPVLSPAYGGLTIRPQVGLMPIGSDPQSGLFEFFVLGSGDAPKRGLDGKLVIRDETGIVLVLLPGGSARIGSQKENENAPHFDRWSEPEERPVTTVELAPFFLAKYELTQGQWARNAPDGENPSKNSPEFPRTEVPSSLAHPVESVSWPQARAWLGRMNLSFPTEAQWEYAARAGTETPWWPGEDGSELQHAFNFADRTALPWLRRERGAGADPDLPLVEDGYSATAPMGALRPNAFGLHEILGNVAEWCADDYAAEGYVHPARAGDGLRLLPEPGPLVAGRDFVEPALHVCRGGGFDHAASYVRCAARYQHTGTPSWSIGLRPARALDP